MRVMHEFLLYKAREGGAAEGGDELNQATVVSSVSMFYLPGGSHVDLTNAAAG